MKAFNVFLSLVMSALIALVVLEGGLRLIGMGPPKTLNHFDPLLGWSKKPGTTLRTSNREFQVTYEINELGLRDDPMSDPTKPANTFRVLMLGDSFTLGWAVDRENLFVDQLERWWKAENRRVDVINAGTEGYSTDQSVVWLLQNGAAFEPDLVLLFPYENDIYWNGQTDYMGKAKPRFTPEGELEEYELVDTTSTSWMANYAVTRRFLKRPDVSSHFVKRRVDANKFMLKEHGPVLTDEPGFVAKAKEYTAGALTAFKRTCDELGATGIVVPIPSKSVVDRKDRARFGEKDLGVSDDRWNPNRPVDMFLTLSKEAGLQALDARTTLKATARGQRLYNKVDWHFNAAGNEAFATFLHDELDHVGAFPPAHAAPKGSPIDLPEVGRSAEGAPFWLKLYAVLWVLLTGLYLLNYRDEPVWQPPLKVAAMLSAIFMIVIGGKWAIGLLPPVVSSVLLVLFVLGIVGFLFYKIGRRLGTIAELMKSFVLRGHWYLMPLIVVLLTIGSLLVVAASSPLVAPFIYTLF